MGAFSFQGICLWTGVFGFVLLVLTRVTPHFCRNPMTKLVGGILRSDPFRSGGALTLGRFFTMVFGIYWLFSGYTVYEDWTRDPVVGSDSVNIDLGMNAIPGWKCKSWRKQRDCYIAGWAFMCWWSLSMVHEQLQKEIAEEARKKDD